MKIKFAITALLCLFVLAACSGNKKEKVLLIDDIHDEEARRGYDVLSIKVNEEELRYVPLPSTDKKDPKLSTVRVQEIKRRKPIFTVSEEFGAAFAFGKADISPRYKTELKKVAQEINALNNITVRIEGYTDSISSDEFNQGLSERRAKAVADYLIKNGVDASIVTHQGYGKRNPIASNETEEGRAKNRRVEIYVNNK